MLIHTGWDQLDITNGSGDTELIPTVEMEIFSCALTMCRMVFDAFTDSANTRCAASATGFVDCLLREPLRRPRFFVFLTASFPAWTIFSGIVSFDRSDEVEVLSPLCGGCSSLSPLFMRSKHTQ